MLKQLENGKWQAFYEGHILGIYNECENAFDAWQNYLINHEITINRMPEILDYKPEQAPIKLQKQINPACCLATAFAMVLDIDQEKIFEMVGHNGTEIIWPDNVSRYRGFHPQELIDVCDQLGFCVTPFESIPILTWNDNEYVVHFKESGPKRMEKIMKDSRGILTGENINGNRHAVAYDNGKIYDPNGTIYDEEQFVIEIFWRVKRMI